MLIRYDGQQQLAQLDFHCNTGEVGLFSNVSANVGRGLPVVAMCEPTGQPAIIVGGGPSVADTLESIREGREKGAKIFALNNAAKFLVERGIKPDVQIVLDARPENIVFVEKAWAGEVLLCSQCHPSLFEKCAEIGYSARIWHPVIEGIEKYSGDAVRVGGGLTVGLSGMCLIYTLGHRQMHLFGYDSCHRGTESHAYKQDIETPEIVDVCVDSRVFRCSLMMAGQAHAFPSVVDMLQQHGCEINVYGDGLVQHWVNYQNRIESQKVLAAVYDLGLSPPTYDFLSFLIEAERHRVSEGYDLIDVIFQPGPMRGFRHDNLPPDLDTRKGMLWRVPVAMARLLPSVRNVMVLQERQDVHGAVFPPEWENEKPLSHYGTCYLKKGWPALRASESARRHVRRITGGDRYVTITIRQSSYWPSRNSDRHEWRKVADWLAANGYIPIFVPDAENNLCEDRYTVCHEAAFDLDIRAALYERAELNLGVLNGPMSLCAFLDCRYLIFNVVVEDAVASSTDFLKSHGFESGDGFGGSGELIWKADTAENILPILADYLTEKTSCPV